MTNRFGQIIREYRERKGLYQEQVADLIGAIGGQISQWERGAITPRIERVHELAEALDIPLEVVTAAWITDVTKVPVSSVKLEREGEADAVEIDRHLTRGHVTRVYHEASGDEIALYGDFLTVSTKNLGDWLVYYDDKAGQIVVETKEAPHHA